MNVAEHLRQARWFGAKSRTIADTRIVDRARWAPESTLLVVEVCYASGTPDTYVVVDNLAVPDIPRALLSSFRGDDVPTEAGGRLEFRPTHVLASVPPDRVEPISLMTAEQSNTSVRFGSALIMKLFRRLQFGPNPDVEVGWFLTEHSQFRGTPAVAGSLEYVRGDGQRASLALLQEFVSNRGDAWSTTLARLADVLDGADPSESIASIGRLGRTTADMHLALAAGNGEFAAEPIDSNDLDAWRTAIRDEVHLALEGLARHGARVDATTLLDRADGIEKLAGSPKTRHHGDYHLGQVLERQDGSFAVIDFEGEPAKPLEQRREKRSPLRDVAGMLRSLDYARHAAVRAGDATHPVRLERAERWHATARAAFLDQYLRDVRATRPALLPADVAAPLDALELEKAAYEVLYELNNRPDWLPIPLAALQTP